MIQDPDGPNPDGPNPDDSPAAASGGDSADERLSDAFWSVARQLRETSAKTLVPWDITPSQLRALRVLTRRGTMRLSALSDHLHIAPRSATEVVDALEARDLVRRRPDPDDRRATLVELTGHGTSVLDAIRGTESERVFGRLSPADRAHLARILRQLRDLSLARQRHLAGLRRAGHGRAASPRVPSDAALNPHPSR